MTTLSLSQLYKRQPTGGPIAVKKEFSVPFESLYIEDGFNVKATIYREVVDGMKATIRADGYMPKIVVEPQSCGERFKVIDGHHRFTAYAELIAEGMEFRRLTVEGFTGSEADQIKLMVTSSQGRNLTPVERANAWGRLTDKFGWTRQEIADEFITSMSNVTHHMAIYELSDLVKGYINDGRIAADYAVELNRKGGEQAVINAITAVEKTGERKATRTSTNAWRPALGKQVCTILKSVNIRREGDHHVARFTDEEWELVQAVLETLSDKT